MDGIPANQKLWDLKPPGADDVGSEEREAKFEASLNTLAEELKANPEQIEATRRALDAPIGLSLVEGKQRTGTPGTDCRFTRPQSPHVRSYKWVIRDQGQFQQTPVIDAEWWEGYQRKILDIAEASYESDSTMPVSDENESTRLSLRAG